MTNANKQLSDNKGGFLHYIGNRNLTWPMQNGRMLVDKKLLSDLFVVILENCQFKKFKRSYEPFAGSASWSLAAMELNFAEEYIINDSDEVLINTLRLTRDNSREVKSKYISLVNEYHHSISAKDFFLQVINSYNQAKSLNEKSLLLPFIVNHSWGGMIFHDNEGNIVYRDVNIRGKIVSEGCLSKASLSIEDFSEEVDRVSHLLKINKVIFKSGDFLQALSDAQEGDFVAMNPPYPETMRAYSQGVGMYTQLYEADTLYKNIVSIIQKMENSNVEYFLTYGCHDPQLKNFIIKDEFNKLKHFFRMSGNEDGIFGITLDQMYFSSKYSIPATLSSKIIPAKAVLQDQELTAIETLTAFKKIFADISHRTSDNIGTTTQDISDIFNKNQSRMLLANQEDTSFGYSIQPKKHIIFLTNVFRIRVDLGRLKSENVNFYLITTESVLNRLEKNQLKYFSSIIKTTFSEVDLENIFYNLIKEKNLNVSEIAIVTNDETAIIPAAKLREKFGIDGATVQTSELFTNKIKMKERMSENGIRVPKFISFNPKEYAANKEDYINNILKELNTKQIFAKPVDSFGSNDVAKLNTRSDLVNWCETHSNTTNFELDEFLEGDLFHVDTIVANGKIIEAQPYKYAYPLAEVLKGKPHAGRLVSYEENDYIKLIHFNHKVLEALQPLPTGVTHLEIFKKQNGEFVFLEIACRPSAGFTPEVSELHCGVNFEEAHYLLQMGLPLEGLISLEQRTMYAAYLFYPKLEGEVAGLTKKLDLKTVCELKYYVKPKDILKSAKHIMDCVATVFMKSEDIYLLKDEFETAINLKPVTII